MSHKAKAILIRCMDFRHRPDLDTWLSDNKLIGALDEAAFAGAAKNLVSSASEAVRDFVLSHVSIAADLHKVQEVILMNHTDCGAYGGRGAFRSDLEERERMVADMREAVEVIRNRFPNLRVRAVLAKIQASGKRFRVTFEEV